MNFQEITKELISGKKVRRSCWETGHYWEMKNSQIKNSAGETPTINAHQLQAVDWELYEEEFCLSDWIVYSAWDENEPCYCRTEYIKEFIKSLKEGLLYEQFIIEKGISHKDLCIQIGNMIINKIDKLAGDELK